MAETTKLNFIPHTSFIKTDKKKTYIYKNGAWVLVKPYIKAEIIPAVVGVAIAGIARAT